jgi:hypothetical protein
MNWHSGFARIAQDRYETDEWVSEIILPYIPHVRCAWECASASGKMARVLAQGSYRIVVESDICRGEDFLEQEQAPMVSVTGIITNPPYKRGIAQRFVEHALDLMKPVNGTVAMLLPHGWDMAQERVHLFEPHPAWRRKIAIRKRIRWFEGTKGNPRGFHAWFLWDWRPGPALPATYWNPPPEEKAA